VRQPGSRDGLTKAQAEAQLRKLMAEEAAPAITDRITVDQAGRHLIRHLEGLGRKRSTIEGYESYLRIHLTPYFGERDLSRIGREDIEAFVATCRRNKQSVKSTQNDRRLPGPDRGRRPRRRGA
jgi:hypothetical protein